jgi:hypothetical protein
VVTALEKKTSTIYPQEDVLPGSSNRKRKFRRFAIPVLLLLAFLGIAAFRPDMRSNMSQRIVSQASSTRHGVQIPETDPPIPELSATFIPPTKIHAATTTPMPTKTATATQTIRPTSTPTLIPTVVTSTITSTPAGYLMTAYYNENSFYILNKGSASRSVAGFVFERIDMNSVIQQRFEGWKWERYFDTIQPNRCLSLEMHASPDAYLRPPECENKVLSPLVLHMDSGELFWASNEPNGFFRILWLGNEIARCEIEAGTCDFYVP